MNDTDSICDSEVDIMDNIAEFDENWRFLCVADVEVDPVCRRLDKTNQKQKYLKRPDFLQISGQHDTNIDDGGERTYTIDCGPMGFGNKVLQTKFS